MATFSDYLPETCTILLPRGPIALQRGNTQAAFIPATQHSAAVGCRLDSLDLHKASYGFFDR